MSYVNYCNTLIVIPLYQYSATGPCVCMLDIQKYLGIIQVRGHRNNPKTKQDIQRHPTSAYERITPTNCCPNCETCKAPDRKTPNQAEACDSPRDVDVFYPSFQAGVVLH